MIKEKGKPFIEKNADKCPHTYRHSLTQLFNCINKLYFQRYE